MRIEITEEFNAYLSLRLAAIATARAQLEKIDVMRLGAEDALTRESVAFSQVVNMLAQERRVTAFDPARVEIGRDEGGSCIVLHDPPKDE